MNTAQLARIVELAEAAGRLILGHYARADIETRLKDDQSPLTAADTASHELIVSGLEATSPWPVLSEESADIPYETRRGWQRFWLVDPLDGTREFLKRNGEFTVNIALVEHGIPVMGVVHAPARSASYFAARGYGAFAKHGAQAKPIAPARGGAGRLAVVMSRSHVDPRTAAFVATLGECEAVSIGSSLKFCLLAEGRAHLYPRFAPTMEWDTAAGQCVLEETGGSVRDLDGRALAYNKPDLHNPFFVARDRAQTEALAQDKQLRVSAS